MKSINALLIATAIFLLGATAAGAYFQQPRLDTEGHFAESMVLPRDIYEHPEKAMDFDFRGVIKIEFMEPIPHWVIVSEDRPLGFTFTMTFVSLLDSLGETTVELGSKDTDVGYMNSMIGQYTTFGPSGTLTLSAGEAREAHMYLGVPGGLDHGMSFPRNLLGGAGIASEHGILVVTNLMNDPYFELK